MNADWDTEFNPFTCTDLEWWNATQMCGGCGSQDCHGGPCGDVRPVFPDPMREVTANVCDRCPERVATGQVRRPL